MKVMKTLTLSLILALTGLVYAAGGGQEAAPTGDTGEGRMSCCAKDGDSCMKDGGGCCTAQAGCCNEGAMCCKDGASCCTKMDATAAKTEDCCAGATCAMKDMMSAKKTGGDSCCMAKVGQKAKAARKTKIVRKAE
jgi:hypothetical protein